MKWKNKKVTELTGGSLSSNLVVVARAVNDNADVLKEAIQKIDELSDEIERLKEIMIVPKKPIMKPYYEDMEEEYLCCPACGEILTDRIPMDNKDFYFHCLNCGQKLDWSDEDE